MNVSHVSVFLGIGGGGKRRGGGGRTGTSNNEGTGVLRDVTTDVTVCVSEDRGSWVVTQGLRVVLSRLACVFAVVDEVVEGCGSGDLNIFSIR